MLRKTLFRLFELPQDLAAFHESYFAARNSAFGPCIELLEQWMILLLDKCPLISCLIWYWVFLGPSGLYCNSIN